MGDAFSATRVSAPLQGAADPFDRPVIVLSAPRSGSTMLFEAMARAPALYTIGGESHRAFESLRALHPASHGFDSNRLTEANADPATVQALRDNLLAALRDREGRPPSAWPVRLLEKTPKNSLRVPFLRAVFPDAHFVVLYRKPRDVLASMIDAWRSGRFRTYPQLPGWRGLPWSLLLVPGWRDLVGRTLEEIVACQWATTMDILLDDLDGLPTDVPVARVRYDTLLESSRAELERVCAFAGLGWDLPVQQLPLSRYTLTPPDPDKWRRHEAELERVLPLITGTIDRVERFFATPAPDNPSTQLGASQ
ncbi:sulfotransferase family protein [Cognatilysobacter lacus]|nr:sulfotransferase [Lysobacter lacus]